MQPNPYNALCHLISVPKKKKKKTKWQAQFVLIVDTT